MPNLKMTAAKLNIAEDVGDTIILRFILGSSPNDFYDLTSGVVKFLVKTSPKDSDAVLTLSSADGSLLLNSAVPEPTKYNVYGEISKTQTLAWGPVNYYCALIYTDPDGKTETIGAGTFTLTYSGSN